MYNIVNKSNGSSVAKYTIGNYGYYYIPTVAEFEEHGSALYAYIGFYYYQSNLFGGVIKINKSNPSLDLSYLLKSSDVINLWVPF